MAPFLAPTPAKQVSAQKASIDNSKPREYMHLHVKLKKMQLEEERLAIIERDNRRLLQNMSKIMRTAGNVDHRNFYEHKRYVRVVVSPLRSAIGSATLIAGPCVFAGTGRGWSLAGECPVLFDFVSTLCVYFGLIWGFACAPRFLLLRTTV